MPLYGMFDVRVYAGGSEEHALGGARRCVQGIGGAWIRKSGGRKQKEGEVAVASSPSYK